MTDETAAVAAAPTRCGFCAIIGAPNAGKSTLVNQMTGSKVSIVSHKVQTTRARIRAIAIDEAKEIIAQLAATKTKAILVINKIDVMSRERLLEVAAEFNAAFPFEQTFMVSALNGSGTADLLKYLGQKMPEGPWLSPEDQVADVQLRFMAAEMTREKIYERLHEELPYASTVETETWEEQKNGSVKIGQVIYVQRDSQKAIVLGKGGQTVKLIGQLARAEMEKQFGRKVHLFLFVKVRENWAEDKERLRNMGLDV